MPSSEFSLIDHYFSDLGQGPAVDLAVGDDCALLRIESGERLATSVDTQVSGVHFPEDTPARQLGFRSVSVAASDLAAMGARPLGMTIALTLPQLDREWLAAFRQGLKDVVQACGLPLVGGDTTRGPLSISVQVMGALPINQALLRAGARVGDTVYVSGTLGDAAGTLAMLNDEWQAAREHADFLLERFYRPTARLDLGRELLGRASAAIDVSDGLLADAAHIARASGVRLRIDPALLPLSPALASRRCRDTVLRWALAGGDDYELCFCLEADAPPADCTRIGEVLEGEGVDCGLDIDFPPGYQHFRDENTR